MADDFVPCTAVYIPAERQIEAAQMAIRQNPINGPANGQHGESNMILPAGELAVLTQRYWGNKGVNLTVSFLEQVPFELRKRIISHGNAWGDYSNVRFVLVDRDGQVRITLAGQGYWSFCGTDILMIERGLPTMCLQGFTMDTNEAEFRRVIRHEFGHTLGFPHEHMRSQIVNRLDHQKTITYFQQTQGWSPAKTQQQVLTPLSQSSIMGTPDADENSIMTYSLPGFITKDNRPIIGGIDIQQQDGEFAGRVYPKPDIPSPPPPPEDGGIDMKMTMDFDTKKMAVSLPVGWQLAKSSNTTEEIVEPNAKLLVAKTMADELEACLPASPPEGVANAPAAGLVNNITLLVTALRAGDWPSAMKQAKIIFDVLFSTATDDGGGIISFQGQAIAAGFDWAKLLDIISRLLPLLFS